ncbi:PTS system, fructose-specific IIA component / PTS system, fructose-specific IIB component / PTS system, fructose-specific IIC component [hydrothermal vent metagenome]|uniref:PTS system, fructose-specific IIA component / PTS system, fructose-specific IIB component / PTS system, fructose-specific IIC component n=1 Tax=hydrothermal vent metagenome TaxID=652676 RepID=A0A3B1E7C2_9ZZZZ
MKLTDFVDASSVNPDLQASTKEEAIRVMVGSLKESGKVSAGQEEAIVAAILKREELGSTGIGKGVAVPHTKHSSVNELVATVALSSDGIDFASLDGEPVYIFFLLISPPEQPADHLRGLESISKHLRSDNFCNFLRQAKSKEDILDLLSEADNEDIS